MNVNFAPATLAEELKQNIDCIIETTLGSVPLFRSFGLDSTDVDLPAHVLQSQMTNKIITAIQEAEPRVKVESVFFEVGGENGRLKPTVKYTIVEEAMS